MKLFQIEQGLIIKLAPIVLFVYKRLSHTKKTIAALSNNRLAKESNLFIYSDGAKNKYDELEVRKTRNYLKTIRGFNNITIIEQKYNKGLANSIIEGVTDIVNKYEKIIVVEDDIVTSPFFLKYMNNALDYYQDIEKVWHISGWNYLMDHDNIDDTFLWRMMDCWGWATWKNRWKYFEKNPHSLLDSFTKEQIYKFNLDDNMNYWDEMLANIDGTLDTWAIFWAATIFKNNGLCLNPLISFVDNIGFDGSGDNTKARSGYHQTTLNHNQNIEFVKNIKENNVALDRIKLFFLKNKNSFKLDFISKVRILHQNISKLKKENKTYIIYGAGSVCDIIISMLGDQIDSVIDMNSEIVGNKIQNKYIYEVNELLETEDKYIIISVLGKEVEISDYLETNFNINKQNIITI